VRLPFHKEQMFLQANPWFQRCLFGKDKVMLSKPIQKRAGGWAGGAGGEVGGGREREPLQGRNRISGPWKIRNKYKAKERPALKKLSFLNAYDYGYRFRFL